MLHDVKNPQYTSGCSHSGLALFMIVGPQLRMSVCDPRCNPATPLLSQID